jgi:hypothetical protein
MGHTPPKENKVKLNEEYTQQRRESMHDNFLSSPLRPPPLTRQFAVVFLLEQREEDGYLVEQKPRIWHRV